MTLVYASLVRVSRSFLVRNVKGVVWVVRESLIEADAAIALEPVEDLQIWGAQFEIENLEVFQNSGGSYGLGDGDVAKLDLVAQNNLQQKALTSFRNCGYRGVRF